AAVVRDRRDVADRADRQAGGGKCLHCRLPSAARTLHPHVDALHPELESFLRCLLCSDGGGEGRRLLGPLEPRLPRASPLHRIACHVGDRDDRVVEGRLDEGDPLRVDMALRARPPTLLRLCHWVPLLTSSRASSCPRSPGGGPSSSAHWYASADLVPADRADAGPRDTIRCRSTA